MSDKHFKKPLKLTNFSLILSGIEVFKNHRNNALERFLYHHIFHLNVIVLHTVIFGEIYWVLDGIQTGKSFVELCLTSPCITISILGTIKSFYLYFNKSMLIQILAKLKEIHPKLDDAEGFETNINNIENKIITDSMKTLKFVTLLLSAISVVVLTMFCFSPLLFTGYNYYRTGELAVNYPYLVKYFFDVYNSEWWPLIYFHQVWATVIVTHNVFGSDTLFYALCVYMDMHFRLLGLQFENVMSSSKNETKRNLATAVARHQELIDLVNLTEIVYSKSSLFNIVTSSLLICLSAFNITVADEISTIFAFTSFLVMSLSQISIMCFFADMLMRSSMEIADSVYQCLWYDADEVTKKTIFLIIMRSQKACRLTACNFADLNLRAFTTILSRSWSYFALLKTIYK